MSDRHTAEARTIANSRAQQAVRLTGRAVEEVRSNLLEPAHMAKKMTGEVYRVALSPEQRKAVDKGAQYFAKPGKGDASLRLRDAVTSKPMLRPASRGSTPRRSWPSRR